MSCLPPVKDSLVICFFKPFLKSFVHGAANASTNVRATESVLTFMRKSKLNARNHTSTGTRIRAHIRGHANGKRDCPWVG